MKSIKHTFVLIFLAISANLQAQNFDIKSFDSKQQYIFYVFSIGDHFFFKDFSTNFVRVNKQSPTVKYEFKLEFDSEKEKYLTSLKTKDQILTVTAVTEEKEYKNKKDELSTKYFRTKVHLYLFDVDGKKTKQVFQKVKLSDSAQIDYDIDYDNDLIYIHQGDSVLQAYDFDLKEVANKKMPKTYETFGSTYSFMDAFAALFKSLNVRVNLSTDFAVLNFGSLMDTTKFEHYAVSHQKVDKELAHFKKYYTNLTVHTNKDGKLDKEIEIDLGSNNIILEAEYRVLNNTNLLVYGKYMEKGSSSNPMYGMFSCVLNKNLDFVKDLKLEELSRVNNEGDIILNRYVGFVLCDLHSPKRSMHIENTGEETFVYTYQARFKDIVDHIYVLRITESGELDINQIGSITKNTKDAPNYHAAFLLKDKIIFYFYDNPLNLDNKTTDMKCRLTNPKSKSNLLVACYYDYANNEFSKKALVTPKKALKVYPSFNETGINRDEENGVYTMFFMGRNKKGKIMNMMLIKCGE